MRPVRPTTHPLALAALILVLLLPASASAAIEERPLGGADLVDLLGEAPEPPWSPEADPCACLAQLRGCLLAATLNLGRCIVSHPVGDALCYIKYEIDILLCIHQADVCASTCIP